MKRYLGAAVAASVLALGCQSPPETQEDRRVMASNASAALESFKASDPSLDETLGKSAGYVIFPEIGKGGVVVGGSYGSGEVYEDGMLIGYAELAQGTVGAQLGAQVFSELIVFRTEDALNDFKDGEFTFAANASAVAIKPGASASVPFENGVAVFTHIKGGLMAEAAIGGQRLTFRPLASGVNGRAERNDDRTYR